MRKFVTFAVLFLCSVLVLNAQSRTFQSVLDLKAPFKPKISTPNDSLDYISAVGTIYSVSATGGGFLMGVNKYGDLGKYQRFDLSKNYLLKGYYLYFYMKTYVGTADPIDLVVKSVNADGSPGATLSKITTTDSVLTTGWNYITLPSYLPAGKSYFIGMEWSAAVDDTFGLACDKAGLGYGDLAKRAWEKGSDGLYYDCYTNWSGLDVDLWMGVIVEEILPVSQARIDANVNFIPDRLNDTLTVSGVVFTPNYQTSHRSYYITDGTAGICTYRAGLTSTALALGDSIVIRGQVQQFNGLTEIVPFADNQIWLIKSGAAVPVPNVLSPGMFKANPEQYEGSLVQIQNLSKISGNWPAAGLSATIKLSNGVDTLDLRIDSDTDVDGSTEPVWPKDVIGVVTQFSSSSVTAGYQLQPRYAATDFPEATPVELSSLSASVTGKSVVINWSTVTEKNNMGFEIQRSTDKVNFTKVGYVAGNGTTLERKNYSFTDNNILSGKTYYRLKQMDYSGSYSITTVVEVESGVINSYSLDQNYPNPFNPSTLIKYSLPSNSNVRITISNALGEVVKELTNELQQSGVHVVNFNATGLSSGVYFYTVYASSVEGAQSFTASKKMILIK